MICLKSNRWHDICFEKYINQTAMKKLFIILTTIMVMSSCATTKEAKLARSDSRKDKKLAEKEAVKTAVESKRFIIKFDRLYFTHGGIADLVPTANYIIIDGDNAIINTAYLGRQFSGVWPVIAINMKGKSKNYSLTNNPSKGTYTIKMDVLNGKANTFDVNLSIGESGVCHVSVSSLMIDMVNYTGHIVPIEPKKDGPDSKSMVI